MKNSSAMMNTLLTYCRYLLIFWIGMPNWFHFQIIILDLSTHIIRHLLLPALINGEGYCDPNTHLCLINRKSGKINIPNREKKKKYSLVNSLPTKCHSVLCPTVSLDCISKLSPLIRTCGKTWLKMLIFSPTLLGEAVLHCFEILKNVEHY